MSSHLTEDVLTVAPDRTARAFNRSGATWAVVLFFCYQHVQEEKLYRIKKQTKRKKLNIENRD